MFHQFISTIFMNQPGFEFVQRGAYRLHPLSHPGIIPCNLWATLFRPHAEFLLSAALTISSRNQAVQMVVCPKCGGNNNLYGRSQEVFRW